MSRRLWSRVVRLERAAQDAEAPRPWLVLNPGQEPPEGYAGELVRVQVFDGRKAEG